MKSPLESVGQLWQKAEREAYRALHARSRVHKADHFLNFCITAHSLRDFFFEHKGLFGRTAQTPYHQAWGKEPLLVAVSEIANLSKHFQLRTPGDALLRPVRTKRFVQREGEAVDVYVSTSGAITNIPRRVRELTIVTADGESHDLWEFQIDVLDYWRRFLFKHGVRVRRQLLDELIDRTDRA